MVSEMEELKDQVLTLQGQVQVSNSVSNRFRTWVNSSAMPHLLSLYLQLETITKQSVGHERDAIQSQYSREKDEWKQNEVHRESLEKRKAEQFRSMDMELRQLRQALSRLRVEWQSEKGQREKAETALLKLTQTNDVRFILRS